MFGHKSLPSRIYSYGSKPPAVGADHVDRQMWLAHQYRNRLVELELARRKRVDEALLRLSPQLVQTQTALTEAEGEIEAARAKIRKQNAQARKKLPADQYKKEELRQLKARRKELWAKRKELRKATFDSTLWTAAQDEINAWANAEGKKAREACNIFWGSYLQTEQSMSGIRSGPPPRFKRWNGDGHLAVQLQGGLSIADALACADNRLRVEPVPPEAYQPGGRRLRKTRVWFRVGTQENQPIWAVLPIVLHRPLPADATIKWAHLLRRRIGTHCEWRVQFVLSKASWPRRDQAEHGTVGIDVGWRIKGDGSLRVAYWVGEDGLEGELALPADWLGEMRRVEKIQGHRDDNLNAIKARLAAWMADPANPNEWLLAQAATLPQWRSAARLAALVLRWREARFTRDETIYTELEAWRKRDKHLLEFAVNLRDQLQRRREDIYRVFAAQMRRRYKTAIIEDLDLRDFHELPQAEEEAADGALREHTRDACLSALIRCLRESMAEVVELPAQDTTKTCDKCGHVGEFDHAPLVRTCPSCGDKDDQDRVAARNLLGGVASGSVTSETKT